MKNTTKNWTHEQIKRVLEIIGEAVAREIALPKIADRGQHKVGSIPRFSLPPLITCGRNCKACKFNCYAIKDYLNQRVKSIATHQARNYNAATEEPEALERYLIGWLHKHRPAFFRVHPSGDFFSVAYAQMWLRVAEACPGTRFLAFTKQFDIVRLVPFWSVHNFSLVLSEWTDVLEAPADLRAIYPTARAVENLDDLRPDEVACPGGCETCGMCWALKELGHNIGFEFH